MKAQKAKMKAHKAKMKAEKATKGQNEGLGVYPREGRQRDSHPGFGVFPS